MDHVAIDLGGRESQICIRREDGELVWEERCPTRSLKKRLRGLGPSRVVVETCAEAFAVAGWAKEAGHEVVVVPATLVRALGVGSRGMKNDVQDARHLSDASCRMAKLPSVHVPSTGARELKAQCTLRESLVTARTQLVNTARAWLRTQGLGQVGAGYPERFPQKFRVAYEARTGQALPPALQRQVAAIEALTVQLAQAEKELEALVNDDPACRRLMTVPGVGPVVAARYRSAVDEVGRFKGAHEVESYFGLTPGEDSSSAKKRTTGITKAGASRVRWVLSQAAWSAWRTRPSDPMVKWAHALAERRGRKVAATALARKMAGVLYAIWRDGSEYDPNHKRREDPTPLAPASI